GRLATAWRWFGQQLLCCYDGGQRPQAELAYIGMGIAAGQQRDTDGADIAAEGRQATQVEWFALFDGQQARAQAWRAIAHHRPGEANEMLRGGADIARSRGIVADEIALLHDLARLGDAADVSVRMADLARESDSPVIHAHAAHASALAARDVNALADVAET